MTDLKALRHSAFLANENDTCLTFTPEEVQIICDEIEELRADNLSLYKDLSTWKGSAQFWKERAVRAEKALREIVQYHIHSEPFGGACSMQEIAQDALKGAQ